jgi:NhaP-type Na+/H+ or K+/H+ antiporter
MLDLKDALFAISGLALLGLTALPLVAGRWIVSVPTIYVGAGIAVAFLPLGWPILDPREDEFHRLVIEHLSEVIVIIALAAAGLALDRQARHSEWRSAWALLGVAMPLTILALVGLGMWAGLGLAAAVLLGAALAPTDPVLAREVAVGGPTEGQEDDVRLALTTESGLNDGLAFPFVWLAILVAEAGTLGGVHWGEWLAWDVFYRIAAGFAVGAAVGWLVGHFSIGPWGDRESDGQNAGLLFLGLTFVAYGATEAVEGYGFLAVFIAARVGRSVSRGTKHEGYVRLPHAHGEQYEAILLAVLLLWLGSFAASGALQHISWAEVGVAFALVFVVRPLAGWVSLLQASSTPFERGAIAFLGIRGMGTFFYLTFAAGHAEFEGLDAVWRIAVLSVLLSIVVHGTLAPVLMGLLERRRKRRGGRKGVEAMEAQGEGDGAADGAPEEGPA